MRRFFFVLSVCLPIVFLLTACGVDTEALWTEVDAAIANNDCETAEPLLDKLHENEKRLEETEQTKLSSLRDGCGDWLSAQRFVERGQPSLSARSYYNALVNLEDYPTLYEEIAAGVVTLYDTESIESLLTPCRADEPAYKFLAQAYFFESGILDEETYKQVELDCMNMIVDHVVDDGILVRVTAFKDTFTAQLGILEAIFSEDEFAALEIEINQRLMANLSAFANEDSSQLARTNSWLEDADFLLDSIRNDFDAQAAYQTALSLYEEAIEVDYGYGAASEALQAFIDEFPDHPLVEEATPLLAEAEAGLERLGVNDDGKIAIYYVNGTPYEVDITFQWNHSGGTFLNREKLILPACENCTRTSGCIESSPIEEIRLFPQEYVISLNIMDSSVLPSGGPVTLEVSEFICISLSNDWLSQLGG